MKTNIIKRTFTILVLTLGFAGGVVADTYTMPEVSSTKEYYLGEVSGSGSVDIQAKVKEFTVDNILSGLGKSTENDLTTCYIRWYMLDDSNNLININNPYNTYKWLFQLKNQWNSYGFYPIGTGQNNENYKDYIGRWYKEKSSGGAEKLQYLISGKVTYQNVEKGSHNRLICEITDIYTASNIPSDANTEETILPTFKLRYIFHFDEEKNEFLNDNNRKAVTSKALSTSYELKDGSTDEAFCYSSTDNKVTVNLSKDAKVAAAGITNKAKYIRWYAVDAAGKQIEMPNCVTLPQGGTVQSNPKNGTIYYNLTKATPLDGITVSGTLAEISAVHLVCVASKDASDITVSKGTVTKEPTWDMQYFINFEAPFKGDAANVTKHNHSFTLPETYWTTLSDNPKVQFGMSNGSNQIKFTYKVNGTESYLTATSNFLTDNKFTSCTLSNDQRFYVRWFLRNKTTQTEYYVNGLLSNDDVKFFDDGRHVYWYSGLDKDNTDLEKIMQVKIDKSKVTNLSDYELVADISTEDADKYKNSDNTLLTHEPDNITAEYVFSFNSRGFEAANIKTNDPEITVVERKAAIDTQGHVYYTLYSEEKTNIEKTLTKMSADNSYIRLSIQKKQQDGTYKNITATEGNYTFGPSYNSPWTATELYGYFAQQNVWNGSKGLDGVETTQYGKKTYYLKFNADDFYTNFNDGDYRLVFYITDDKSGIDVKWDNSVYKMTYEPTTIKMMYVYTLFKEDLTTFKHYKGYAYHDDATKTEEWASPSPNNYQDVHLWEYEMYVEPGKSVTLDLPIVNSDDAANVASSQVQEPVGYYRWYDYTTDKKSEQVSSTTIERNSSQDTYATLSSQDYGLMFYEFPSKKGVNATIVTSDVTDVTFTAPSTDWKGTTIACDVSRYVDGVTDATDNYLLREPTLSMRYIFHIHPATEIADSLKKAIVDSNGKDVYESFGYTTIGVKGSGSNALGTANLRVNLHDASDYYFYNYKNSNKLVASGTNVSNEFGTDLIHATQIRWFAYDVTGQYYKELKDVGQYSVRKENGKLIGISLGFLNSGDFTAIDNNSIASKQITLTPKDVVYIVGYAADDGSNMCPVVSYTCRFLSDYYPMLAADIEKNAPERTIDWLNANYTPVAKITFDEDSKNATLKAPTNQFDNMTDLPSKWGLRHYGFVYSGLVDKYDSHNTSHAIGGGLTPFHGEYGLYKSAKKIGISNETNVTLNGTTISNVGYCWYYPETNVLEDRTAKADSQSGYFLYVDASEEARPICSAEFDANLCAGSTFVLSAAVANVTGSNTMTAPQLMFRLYGAKENTTTGEYEKDKLIHTFATCDFSTVAASTMAQWYQVYAKVTLQQNTDVENYSHFIVEVDNYAANTLGNDFAIDDIRFWQSNANILATQDAPVCGTNDKGKVTFKIPHESIVAKFGNTKQWAKRILRWRIMKKGDKGYEALSTPGGTVTVYRNSSSIEGSLIEDITDDEKKRYQTINGTLYLVLAEDVELSEGDYYISASLQSENSTADNPTADADYGSWGYPEDKCSVYSEYFTLGKQELSIESGNTTSKNKIIKDCASNALKTITTDADGKATESEDAMLDASMTVPDPINGGTFTLSNVVYDWFVGSNEEYSKAEYKAEGSDAGTKLDDALTAFRRAYPLEKSYDPPEKSYDKSTNDNYTEAHKAAIKSFVDNGQLFLGVSKIKLKKLTTTTKTQYFYLKPLTQKVERKFTNANNIEETKTVKLCTEGSEISLSVATNGPSLNLGFANVTYPASSGYRSVRLGLKQHLQQMTSMPLRLPIHDFTHKVAPAANVFNLKAGTGETGTGEAGTDKLWISASNDPTWMETLKTKAVEVGFIKDMDAHYVYIQLQESTGNLAFHEGYWYDADFTIYDSGETVVEGGSHCTGDVFFRIKVVPEYVTWTAKADVNYGSTNWNNDENWTRSKKDELHKTDYADNGEKGSNDDLSGLESGDSQIKTYVPMKFTKVTVPALDNFSYAYLAKMETKANGILKDDCLSNADHYAATENIQYDIMVKMTADTEDENESGAKPTVTAYGCEKFYGNTCQQIYFKPEAELRQQQYLNYKTAWVEKELEANKWYMLATPLQDTYAGDMYVPVKNGRQETEAFTAINFSTSDGYSRNTAPIYQRSWDRSDSKELMNDSGTILEDEKADISYSDWSTAGTTTLLKSNWSHVYNDMSVKYYDESETAPRYGFSLRAGNANTQCLGNNSKDNNSKDNNSKWLIRLPKADTKYDYYYQNDATTVAGKSKGVSITKTGVSSEADTGYGKLLIDQNNYSDGGTEYGVVRQKLTNSSSGNGLYLVSNPYMKTLDMAKFFTINPGLEKKFWTIQDGTVRAATAEVVTLKGSDGTTEKATYWPSIKPLQSFFVKKKDSGSDVTEVMFNTNITTSTQYIYGEYDEPATASDNGSRSANTASTVRRYKTRSGYTAVQQPSLNMTATNSAGKSVASVVVRDDADADFVDSEDVEMLYDSNLADLPMLYTVAGTMAVSLNALPEVKMLPLGIVSSTTTDATLTITGSDSFNSTLYLYDSKTKKSTELTEPTTVTIAANAHGRYYLTTVLPEQIEETDQSGIHCYSPQPGVLVVSSPMDELQQVDVYGIDGTLIKRLTPAGVTSVTETLSRNIYIVKVRTAGGSKTVKIRVN